METLLVRKGVLLNGIVYHLHDLIQKRYDCYASPHMRNRMDSYFNPYSEADEEFERELSEQLYKIRASQCERFELLIPSNEQEGGTK